MLLHLWFALCLLSLLPSVLAAFNYGDRVCWRRDCIIRTDAGTLCFEPHNNGIKPEECADSFLKNLTHIHTTSALDRSILYYDVEGRVRGAATWTIPPVMAGSVFVCMTGRQVDDPKQYSTVCREAQGDNDMESTAAHARECVSDQKPRYMSDGCFSIDRSVGSAEDHKEWYEQPVVAGFFWVLGALLMLGSVYMWGGKAVRAVKGRLPARLVGYGVVVARLARGWHQRVPPLPTQQPGIILEQPHTNGTVRHPETFGATIH